MGNINVLLMAVIVNVTGLEGVKKMLENADKAINQELSNEIASAANNIRNSAIRLAPVNFGVLRGSIVAEKITDLSYIIEARVKYAAYVEFGTGGLVTVPSEYKDYAILFKGKGLRKVNMRAQPYLFPSLEMEKPKLIQRLKALINA